MKDLRKYIDESLMDSDDEIISSTIKYIDEKDIAAIKKFIISNYDNMHGKTAFKISKKRNKDGKFIVSTPKKDLILGYNRTHVSNGLFQWKSCENFYSKNNYKLESLEGCPEVVTGDFWINNCKSLKTLKGAPKEVGGRFVCSGCPLESLEGCPEKVGSFNCDECRLIKNLEGGPKEVKFHYSCTLCDSLETLDGAPNNIRDNFHCSLNKSLKSLKGAPEYVRYFYCSGCESLKSLEGAPKKTYYCAINNNPNLKSLKGLPEVIVRSLELKNNDKEFTVDDIKKYVKEIGSFNDGRIMF